MLEWALIVDSANQPKALRVLFFAETWERFSYYGMRALLIYYMTRHFKYSDDAAYVVYGAYTSLVYTTPVIGGMLADRLLGGRKAVVFGGLLMALGHFAMAFDQLFFLALALLICGNGFFKPNISTIVGRVYSDDDHKRDRAFAIFYMGINLGGMCAGLCGHLGETYSWHVGFGLAGIGMLIGLGVFLWGQRFLAHAGDPPDPVKLRAPFLLGLSREHVVYVGALVAVGVAWVLVQQGAVLGSLLLVVGLLTLAGLIYYLVRHAQPAERGPMFVALVLIVFSTVFWAFFEQAGSSMALFTERNVDRAVLGSEIKPSVFASANSAYVLLFSPVFIWLWRRLGRFEPSTPLKFGLGTLQLGLGFGALWLGAISSQSTGLVPVFWLLLAIALHTTGELCLSPVGLSMITKLSPPRIVGMMMGAWFLASAEAQYMASVIARLTGVKGAEHATAAVSPAATVMVYGSVFGSIAVTALVIGGLMCVASPFLARRMGSVR
jgi:proton-dependent oligopeptide transporter, POT family